jgi:hypothetical protein
MDKMVVFMSSSRVFEPGVTVFSMQLAYIFAVGKLDYLQTTNFFVHVYDEYNNEIHVFHIALKL